MSKPTVEELLKPRYKVIAKMPILPFEEGEIYNTDVYPVTFGGQQFYVRLDMYPHLFKKLEWWEDRDRKDMPEYIRFYQPLPERFKIGKVEQWRGRDIVKVYFEISFRELGSGDLPATKEEYEQYIQQTTNND